MTRKIEAWEAESDGSIHQTQQEAVDHNRAVYFSRFYDEHPLIIEGDEITDEQIKIGVTAWVLTHEVALLNLLEGKEADA
jgi:hypothetical protein